MPDLFISTDVETDGPIQGPYSMLSIGSVVVSEEGELLERFSANLDLLPDAQTDPRTMAWWAGQPAAWAAHRTDTRPPDGVMNEYARWVEEVAECHRSKPVFVAWPTGFDFTFVYWYLIRFAGHSPFGHSALDMRSYAMGMLGRGYRQVRKNALPKVWRPPDHPHTHIALDDAIEQGLLFANMLKANAALARSGPALGTLASWATEHEPCASDRTQT